MIMAQHVEPQHLNRGRPTKFTPERINQISNLVERGKSRDEIAEIIGVTTGTLQVTCSKLGVSLRRPTFDTGTGLLPRQPPRDLKKGLSNQTGSRPESWEKGCGEGSHAVPRTTTTEEGRGRTPPTVGSCGKVSDGSLAAFAIRMEYKGQERSTGLPLDEEMIGQLAMEAEVRDMRIGELVAALIRAIVKKDLFHLIRDESTQGRG